MTDIGSFRVRPNFLGRTTRVLAKLAGLVLILLVLLVTASVFARYFFNAPLLGANEVVQLGAVALVMLAMPYCTSEGAHVRADVFDPFIGRLGRFAGDIISRGLAILALVILVSRSWQKTMDAIEFDEVSNMLGMPIWPFYGLICAGMALSALVLALQAGLVMFGRGGSAE